MKSLIFAVAAVLPAIQAIQIYSHLPLHSETYVRHELGRIRRNAGGVPPNIFLPNQQANTVHVDADGNYIFPTWMKFTLNMNGKHVTLNLKLNRKQRTHTPVTVVTNGNHVRFDNTSPRIFAFYQMMNGPAAASVMVKCPVVTDACHIVGRVTIKGEEYVIEPGSDSPQPVDRSVLHNIYKVPPVSEEANDDDVVETVWTPGDGASPIVQRTKRQTSLVTYEIELMLVTDSTIYDYWYGRLGTETAAVEEIQKYYEQLANSMDMRYSTATTSSMQIDIIPFKILVLTTNTDSPWVNNMGVVDNKPVLLVYDALTAFQSWVGSETVDSSVDAIQTYTRLDLASSSSASTTGLARMITSSVTGLPSSIPCVSNKMALSIVEDGASVERTAAHELAHNLGIRHDPYVGCSNDFKFTMSSSSSASVPSSIALNPWKFSSCSISELARTLTESYNSQPHCLSESSSYNATNYDRVLSDEPLGQIYNLDAQCQQQVGLTSIACTSSSSYPISDICYKGLMCSSTSGSCTTGIEIARVFAGSDCETGKWCEGGACVVKPTETPCDDQTMAQVYEDAYNAFDDCLVYTCIAICNPGEDSAITCTPVQIC